MKKIVEIFKVLGEENRLKITLILKEKPMCVCEIKEVLDIAMSTLSAHLKILKLAGVIEDYKRGRWIEYRVSNNPLIETLIKEIQKELISDNNYLEIINKAKNTQILPR
ncbi:MAG: metalloregulator ArsR/SmtB family transcription factor [Deferribacterales bacterium]